MLSFFLFKHFNEVLSWFSLSNQLISVTNFRLKVDVFFPMWPKFGTKMSETTTRIITFLVGNRKPLFAAVTEWGVYLICVYVSSRNLAREFYLSGIGHAFVILPKWLWWKVEFYYYLCIVGYCYYNFWTTILHRNEAVTCFFCSFVHVFRRMMVWRVLMCEVHRNSLG